MKIIFYDCITAAGFGVPSLMEGLYAGKDHSTPIKNSNNQQDFSSGSRICFIPNIVSKDLSTDSVQDKNYDISIDPYKNKLVFLLKNLCTNFLNQNSTLISHKKILVLLSSTKGSVEDYIWKDQKFSENPDPFQNILEPLSEEIKTHCKYTTPLVVSNACASSHVAFQLAQNVLDSEIFDYVLLFTADLIGPFIYNGFHSLKILTQSENKPFDKNRDGLQLGEACSFFVLTKKLNFSEHLSHSGLEISSVATEIEGASMTKPSHQGESLFRCLMQLSKMNLSKPDFIMAHATGTMQNDFAEEAAINKYCKNQNIKIPILGSKWSIGHTLGSSGGIDVIAACEVLKRKELFSLKNTKTPDPQFESLFSIYNEKPGTNNLFNIKFNSAIVTSLGFGGIHAALLLRKC